MTSLKFKLTRPAKAGGGDRYEHGVKFVRKGKENRMKSLTVYVGIFKDGKCEERLSGNFTVFPDQIKAMDNFIGLLDAMCPDRHFYIAWDYIIKTPRPESLFPRIY